ncbi:MAG TPA: hypothetical protein VMY98_09845 [Anaerolineae bacterium]|nr:hypothetical protein [Anaerolineae bacterium]
MTKITREFLHEMMRAEGADQAPAGAGFWIMSKEEWRRIAKLREPFGGYMLPGLLDGRPSPLFGRHIVRAETGNPIRFVLWCSRCGRFLRWDGTGHCQHCYTEIVRLR